MDWMEAHKSLLCCYLHCRYPKSLLIFSWVQTPWLQEEHIPSLHPGIGVICSWRSDSPLVLLWYLPGTSSSWPSVWTIPITYQNTENLDHVKMEGRIWKHESRVTIPAQPSAHFVVSGKTPGCLSVIQVKYFRCYSQILHEGLHYYCNKLL